MAARKYSLIIALLLAVCFAGPLHAQVIPDPSANRQLYIRNAGGKIIQRLSPQGDHYDVFDMRHQFTVLGYARMLGTRLVFYDLRNRVMATARAELVPPDSSLAVITIVRDPTGHPIGMLERY